MKIILFIIFLFFYCEPPKENCNKYEHSEAVLIAYRVSKHSHLWFQNPKTKKIYDIYGVGGRRQPTINLGEKIKVKYCNVQIIFNKYKYVEEPIDRKTRFIYSEGYGYLYGN